MEYTEMSEREAAERFDEMLDECYDAIEICGLTYAPSVALKRVDPVAYRCALLDYADSMEWEL